MQLVRRPDHGKLCGHGLMSVVERHRQRGSQANASLLPSTHGGHFLKQALVNQGLREGEREREMLEYHCFTASW